MKASIHVAAFGHRTPIDTVLKQASQFGFDAVELTIGAQGPLAFETPEPQCRLLARRARDLGLAISAIGIEDACEAHFASPDSARRQAAWDRTVAALDRAYWLGADVVALVPAVVGGAHSPRMLARYEDAFALASEALLSLRFEAQQRAVHIACRNGWNRFLLSPVEMRGFVDLVNSPWVGVYLSLAATLPWGYPQDWIQTLGHRLVRVRFDDFDLAAPGFGAMCPLGAGDVDWPAVGAALRQVRYDGPATCSGQKNSANLKAQLDDVLHLGGLSDPGPSAQRTGDV